MRISYIYAIRVLDYVYIGQHTTDNINDNYYGSGQFIVELRHFLPIQFFHKQILEIVDDEEVNEKELFYINVFKKVFNEKCLNFTSPLEKKEILHNITFLKSLIEKVNNDQLKQLTEKMFLRYFHLQKDFSLKQVIQYIDIYNSKNDTIKDLKSIKEKQKEMEIILKKFKL